MNKKKFIKIIILIFFVQLTFFYFTEASTGTIIESFDTNKVCHDFTCITPTPGVINWKPTGQADVIIDDDTGLSGKIWGNELGWITLNPTGPDGVYFSDPSSGTLAGKAWSQVAGWINFAPTGQQVIINPSTGEFSGWAWAGGAYGGWIKFNCDDVNSCIKTSWRNNDASEREIISSGGVLGEISYDVCTNIDGFQNDIPIGYTIYDTDCVLVVDVCTNISGYQTEIPTGFKIRDINQCELLISDPVDFCSNILGEQSVIPKGFIISNNGECVMSPDDLCINLEGFQEVIPNGFLLDGGLCIFSISEKPIENIKLNEGNIDLVSYSFIPDKLKVPSDNTIIKEIIKVVINPQSRDFNVDLVSFLGSILGILIIIITLIRFLSRVIR
ncbi:MAG: hypothetical protein KBC44_00810 [Candidatus Pacebacteria bacterium]|nr:hypothetical protein [Candidatus Paceibacterota bacterium]